MNVFTQFLRGSELDVLSAREYAVAFCIARGMKQAAIAKRLQIDVKTVATYRDRMLHKLDISSNAELAVLVYRLSELDTPPAQVDGEIGLA